MLASGWILALALTVVLPDGQRAVQHGRANASFATLELCEAELRRFNVNLLPAGALAPGARVVTVQAACVPVTAPSDTPPRQSALRPSSRDYAA